MKKILIIAMLGIMVFMMAGCQKDEPRQTSNTSGINSIEVKSIEVKPIEIKTWENSTKYWD